MVSINLQRKLHIVVLVVACALGLGPKASAQSPPLLQCVGGKSLFAVNGDSLSTFRYSITGGVFLDTTRHDSVVVQWGLQEGLYRIGVQEIAFGGCEGEWSYLDIELEGTPFDFAKTDYTLCPGDTLRLPIDANLYTTMRWSDPEIAMRGIVQPGHYQVWLKDQNGCTYTDTLEVGICELPPIRKSLIKSPSLPIKKSP